MRKKQYSTVSALSIIGMLIALLSKTSTPTISYSSGAVFWCLATYYGNKERKHGDLEYKFHQVVKDIAKGNEPSQDCLEDLYKDRPPASVAEYCRYKVLIKRVVSDWDEGWWLWLFGGNFAEWNAEMIEELRRK
jgi:hypothetical protein